jgi:hypothetical protein
MQSPLSLLTGIEVLKKAVGLITSLLVSARIGLLLGSIQFDSDCPGFHSYLSKVTVNLLGMYPRFRRKYSTAAMESDYSPCALLSILDHPA